MIARLAMVLCVIASPVAATAIYPGTIDSMDTGGISDVDVWPIQLVSDTFSVQFRYGGVVGGGCYNPSGMTPYQCPGTVTLFGHSEASGILQQGTGVVNGVSYPLMGFLPDTTIALQAAPLAITLPGFYSVPFTMSGHLTGFSLGNVVLDEDITGSGIAYLHVVPVGTSSLQIVHIQWQFTPEPSTVGLIGMGLALLVAIRRR